MSLRRRRSCGYLLGLCVVKAAVVGSSIEAVTAQASTDGAAKLRMVEAWLARTGTQGAHIRFFSDHVSDLPVFERAAEQIATTPSPKLRALAEARGWAIVDWH